MRWTSEQVAALALKRGKAAEQPAKPLKYRNTRVQIDGIGFDSKAEASHYGRLKTARSAGLLTFERQVPFVFVVNGHKIATYRADFVVTWKDGRTEVQDVKGVRTPEYKLKKKLMLALFGIEIKELT